MNCVRNKKNVNTSFVFLAVGIALIAAILLCCFIFVPAGERISVADAASSPIVVEAQIADAVKAYGDFDPSFKLIDENGEELFIPVVFKREPGENAGEYAISVDMQATDSNYDCSLVVAGKLTIEARQITISSISEKINYGDAEPEYRWVLSRGKMQYNDIISSVNVSVENNPNVGEYPLTLSDTVISDGLGNDVTQNYSILYDNGNLTIDKQVITVTSQAAKVAYGDVFTAEVVGLPDRLFNGHTLYAEFDGYSTFALGEKTLTFNVYSKKGGKDTSDEVLPNFTINKKYSTLTVTKRAVFVSVDAVSQRYNGTFNIPYSITDGLLAGHSVAGKLSKSDPAISDVGVYSVSIGTLTVVGAETDVSQYYEFVLSQSVFTILPLEISVVFDAVATVYGEPEYDFTYYNDLLNSYLVESDKTYKFLRENTANKAVGDYNVILDSPLTENYNLNLINAVYNIVKRPITVKIENLNQEYGSAQDVLEYNTAAYTLISGSLVGDEKFNVHIVREPGNSIGKYSLSLVGVDLPQYAVTLQESFLNINPKRVDLIGVTVANKVYDGTDKAFLFNVPALAGVLPGEDVTVQLGYTGRFENAQIGNLKRVFIENVKLVGTDSGNYILNPSSLTLTANITVRTLSDNTVSIFADDFTTIKPNSTLTVTSDIASTRKGLNLDEKNKIYSSILAHYYVKIIYDSQSEPLKGVYTIKFEIPDKFKNLYHLKICVIDANGNAQLLETFREGNTLSVTARGEFSEFIMVTKDSGWQNTVLIVMSVISSIIIIALITVLIIKKTRKGINKNATKKE